MSQALLIFILSTAYTLGGLLIALYVKNIAVKAIKEELPNLISPMLNALKEDILCGIESKYITKEVCHLQRENTNDKINNIKINQQMAGA